MSDPHNRYRAETGVPILLRLSAVLFIAAASASSLAPAAPAAIVISKNHQSAISLGWRDTGVRLAPPVGRVCIEPLQPGVLLVSDPSRGTLAYNWQNGKEHVVNSRPFEECTSTGWLYSRNATPPPAGSRFSLLEPAALPVEHIPTDYPVDGSPYLYRLASDGIYVSTDDGLTWQQRGEQFGEKIRDMRVAARDGRVVYILLIDEPAGNASQVRYTIYASADAGATWEQRSSGEVPSSIEGRSVILGLYRVPGITAPVDMVGLRVVQGVPTQEVLRAETFLSSDGGRTLQSLGRQQWSLERQYVHTSRGLLRLHQQFNPRTASPVIQSLELSTDGGRTWQPLSAPPLSGMITQPQVMSVAPSTPSGIFLSSVRDPLLYSADSGRTWQQFENRGQGRYYITPYIPVTVLSIESRDSTSGSAVPATVTPPVPAQPSPAPPSTSTIAEGILYALELPSSGSQYTSRVPPSNAPGSVYMDKVGHNLSGAFRTYWERNGGLAQFGYPRTEPLHEVSATDGRVYKVQYFERNRFEYHPEHRGTEAEILLGLLGNEQTASRRRAGEAPFTPVANPNLPAVSYFGETGHTLRGVFKEYWETHGGLALYGFPISEEFDERNPEDGKTYKVQYFERNRFEYHPQNRGTPYEVLLGLLGNTLLKQKGWD